MSDDYKAALDALKTLTSSLEAAEHRRCELRKELAQLKRQGLTPAKAHWRKGKYLYLIHPQKPGQSKRYRQYIGVDEARVREALACIERTRLYEARAGDLARLTRYLQSIADELQRLTSFSYDY